jgi:hypothetical protein
MYVSARYLSASPLYSPATHSSLLITAPYMLYNLIPSDLLVVVYYY